MAIIDIPKTENKWLIFFLDNEPNSWFNSPLGSSTTYNDEVWTVEEYDTEEEWIIRLIELGIDPDE